MKKVYINNQTGAIIIVSSKNDIEYINNTIYTLLFEGYYKQCINHIEQYFIDNYIPDEQQEIIND